MRTGDALITEHLPSLELYVISLGGPCPVQQSAVWQMFLRCTIHPPATTPPMLEHPFRMAIPARATRPSGGGLSLSSRSDTEGRVHAMSLSHMDGYRRWGPTGIVCTRAKIRETVKGNG